MIVWPMVGSLAFVALLGCVAHAAEQADVGMPPASPPPPVGTASRWQTFAVVLEDPAIPSWFGGLTIPGLRRVDRLEMAEVAIVIHGDEPSVTWSTWYQEGGGRYPWLRGRKPWLLRNRGADLLGCGQHALRVTVMDRQHRELTTIDLSIDNAEVRWRDPAADPRFENRAYGDPFAQTPDGRALAWCRQVWASAFANLEAILEQRIGHSP